MDNGKINQSELKFGGVTGEASVNLYTGRMVFEHPDRSIGANSYQINISHIYGSQFGDSIAPNRNSYMGKGCKLNVQQFLFPYNSSYGYPSGDGFVSGDYVYLDTIGHRHRFTLLTGSKYYDTSGLGLTLTVTGSDSSQKGTIEDEFGNKMVFNLALFVIESSESVVSESNANPDIKKEYIYTNHGSNIIKLMEVRDARKPNRKIMFEYNDTAAMTFVK